MTFPDSQDDTLPQSQANFEERYRLYTGIPPILHQEGYYPIEVEDPYDKWGPELRIYFPDSLRQLDLPARVEICEGNAPGISRINNNNFWWQLTRAGFRLGRNHWVEGIRQTVPPRYRQGFDRGYGL